MSDCFDRRSLAFPLCTVSPVRENRYALGLFFVWGPVYYDIDANVLYVDSASVRRFAINTGASE